LVDLNLIGLLAIIKHPFMEQPAWDLVQTLL